MSVLFVALPVALLLGGSAVAAFIWATRGGQFDDLETPRWRVLTDECHPTAAKARSSGANHSSSASDHRSCAANHQSQQPGQ